MTDLDRIEALVGPLPKGREYLDGGCRLDDYEETRHHFTQADAALAEAYARLDHALSWDGVEEYIDRTYPPHIFTGVSGDPGPRILVLLRELKRVEAEVERYGFAIDAERRRAEKAEAEVKMLRDDNTILRVELDEAESDTLESVSSKRGVSQTGNTADSANTDEATWHYAAGHYKENGEDWYDVREVYRGLEIGDSYTRDGIAPIAESLRDLTDVLHMMLTDIGQFPVVEVDSPSAHDLASFTQCESITTVTDK